MTDIEGVGVGAVYPEQLDPLYPVETDAFLAHIPRTQEMGTAKSIHAAPSEILEMLHRCGDAIRGIEVDRRAIAGYATTFEALINNYPEDIAALPEEAQAQMKAWVSRLAPGSEEPASNPPPIYIEGSVNNRS